MALAIQYNPTFSETIKIRLYAIPNTLLRVVEGVGRAALAALALIAYLATFGVWQSSFSFAAQQWSSSKQALQFAEKYFLAFFCPIRSLDIDPRFVEPIELTGQVRENRVRVGAERIERKLEREWTFAQGQMEAELDGPFRYMEGNLGHAEKTQVGGLDVGVCHFIGRRLEMEDEHIAEEFHVMIGGQIFSGKLFGVFDGHGGSEAAGFLKNNLKAKLEEKLEAFNRAGISDEGIWNALKLTFVELNREFNQNSGSTATVAMIFQGNIWTANLGDSRTILQNGEEILQLSQDANPDDARYAHGIENRGGEVIDVRGVHRVNGIMAVARSLGDRICNGAMSARPKITKCPLRPNSRLILACDGVYDVASTRQVGAAARLNVSCAQLAQNIVTSAYNAGSRDNLSAMVINLG